MRVIEAKVREKWKKNITCKGTAYIPGCGSILEIDEDDLGTTIKYHRDSDYSEWDEESYCYEYYDFKCPVCETYNKLSKNEIPYRIYFRSQIR